MASLETFQRVALVVTGDVSAIQDGVELWKKHTDPERETRPDIVGVVATRGQSRGLPKAGRRRGRATKAGLSGAQHLTFMLL